MQDYSPFGTQGVPPMHAHKLWPHSNGRKRIPSRPGKNDQRIARFGRTTCEIPPFSSRHDSPADVDPFSALQNCLLRRPLGADGGEA